MLDFLELEETVGRAWHRLVGRTASVAHYPDHAVSLTEIAPVLAVCFRGFGGEGTVQLAPARGRTSSHRLNLRQRLGLGEEKIIQPGRDHASLMLPRVIDLFGDRKLNRDLYLWLAAAMATMDSRPAEISDPLLRDLDLLARARQTVSRTISQFPGLAPKYRALCAATLDERPKRQLPPAEALVESHILSLLRAGAGQLDTMPSAMFPAKAPAGYLPMLNVCLWPQALLRPETAPRERNEDEQAANTGRQPETATARHIATREKQQAQKAERSPFILNRFEKILAMSEMVNVDRPTDDSDDHDSKAADELDELVLGERKGRPSAKFRFDLDLPPEAVADGVLSRESLYPEWDYRKAAYRPDFCSVISGSAKTLGDAGETDEQAKALIRKVRRQFEILRPRHEILRAQFDGADLDLDAVVRARTDLAAGGQGSDRIHLLSRPQAHDLAVTILVDVSLSTDAWFDNLRVLDVEKEALLVLAHGLAAAGDNHSILTFTSRRRDWVRVETVKDFGEPMSALVERRIAGLRPGYYTRIGAAIRHAKAGLDKQQNRRKLLLVLTDGKPNDVDHYEGRYALEDSRKAVLEARRAGIHVFGVTIDKDAQSYIPAMFGQNGFAVINKIAKLPQALPKIYRGLAG